MNLSTIKTPGVYLNELNAFPNSVVAVPTAVPVFIGYTPQASYEGESYDNKPMKITSFAEFEAIYCYPNPDPPADPAKQYSPQYYLVKQDSKPDKGTYLLLGSDYYSIVPDANTIYYLYNSVQLFYNNGGGDAYIVSVGTYGPPSGKPISPGDPLINPNVQVNDLLGGLELLKNEEEPTMYICPEATLLSVENNAALMQEMLLQNSEMMTAVSIFDIIGGNDPDPILYTSDIETFRENTGNNGLKYGTAYYPFVGTTIMQSTDLDYTNLFGGDVKQLAAVINPDNDPTSQLTTILSNIEKPTGTPLTVSQYNNSLISGSKTYNSVLNKVLALANVLPPSGGMAGAIATVDNQIGPWKAAANMSIVGAVSLPIKLSKSQQGPLNIDAVSGKSINAIRFFNGQGILVWGARTLDGNSLDWQYLPVRRTVTFLEQSCKLAANAYVFEPNVKNTWESVKSMIGSFLTSIWKEGGLMGASPDDAFQVQCGLGTTMTAQDILAGYMRVTVKIAVVRPAEFIVLTFVQQMPKSS
jgi:uncharacterized protein